MHADSQLIIIEMFLIKSRMLMTWLTHLEPKVSVVLNYDESIGKLEPSAVEYENDQFEVFKWLVA